MATVVVTRRRRREQEKPQRTDLTPTGLLMEGDYTHNPVIGEMAMFREQPHSFRLADIHVSLCQEKTQIS